MWANIAAIAVGVAGAALAGVLGFLQTVSPTGVAGTNPIKVALVTAGLAALTRGINWLISKL